MLIVFLIILLTLVLFVTQWLPYDLVALLTIFLLVVTKQIDPENAFLGFSDPAVITVAAVLVISEALTRSGFSTFIIGLLGWTKHSLVLQILILCSMVALLSGIMNNVGALALMMPIAIRMSYKTDFPISAYLIPLAFSSILGGLFTLIGTPANLIVSSFRKEELGAGFAMFDFVPVGGFIMFFGVIFVSLLGWRLIPRRQEGDESKKNFLNIESYLSELVIKEGSSLAGKSIGTLSEKYEDINIIAYEQDNKKYFNPSKYLVIKEGDTLIIELAQEELEQVLSDPDLSLSKRDLSKTKDDTSLSLNEVVVTSISNLKKKSLSDIGGFAKVTVLAIARHGMKLHKRISKTKLLAGDILLLHGESEDIEETIVRHDLLSMRERDYTGKKSLARMSLAIAIFFAFITTSLMGWLPIHVSLVTCAVTLILLNFVTVKEAYTSIDWGVIILLGALFPMGDALVKSGAAEWLAQGILSFGANSPPTFTLIIVMVGTLLLSNVINNAAATVLIAPIALSVAKSSNLNVDMILMAVAISASCAFLTPIGHQSNTLVYAPGGYKFGDYAKVGLPLSFIALICAIIGLNIFW